MNRLRKTSECSYIYVDPIRPVRQPATDHFRAKLFGLTLAAGRWLQAACRLQGEHCVLDIEVQDSVRQ